MAEVTVYMTATLHALVGGASLSLMEGQVLTLPLADATPLLRAGYARLAEGDTGEMAESPVEVTDDAQAEGRRTATGAGQRKRKA